MATKRMEDWEASDFYRNFRDAADSASDGEFKEKLAALATEIEPLGREFVRETVGCGRDLSSVMEEFQAIAAKAGYCVRPRGFGGECRDLSHQVDRTISHLRSLRESCFV